MSVPDFAFRLLAAFVLGGIIGMERQIHGRPAGLRTHILVCLGAAVAIIAGIQAEHAFPDLSIDTGRIIAGIITGIGFLGAGTIVRYREGVGGLTTAACIWFVAMIGILCGFAFYYQAAIASVAALLVLLVLDNLEDRMPSASHWMLTVKSCDRSFNTLRTQCEKILKTRGIHVKSSTFSISDNKTELNFVLRTRKRRTDYDVVEQIKSIEGVENVRWSHRAAEW